MSRYVDNWDGDSRRPSVARHDGTYQTVEELTEQLETNVAAAAAAARGRFSQQYREKEGKSVLFELPSPSSSAWNVADVIALYMRRQRYAIQRGREERIDTEDLTVGTSRTRRTLSSSSTVHDKRLLQSYSPKLLLLGVDAVVQELAATLRAEAKDSVNNTTDQSNSSTSHGLQGPRFLSGSPSSSTATTYPSPEVYTIPDAVDGLDALRAELCRWCDVILFCYRVSDPTSFVHLQNEVMPAVLAACSSDDGDADGEDADACDNIFSEGNDRSAAKFSDVDVSRLSQSGVWPAVAPPFIIVGLGAEARLNRPTDLQAPWITNADILGFAAEAGVQRVVELYSHSPRHVQILLQHCRTLRDVGYEAMESPAAQGRRAALKEFGLHALLRAPPPLLELQPGTRSVHVALPPRIPTTSTAALSNSVAPAPTASRSEMDGVQCYYYVSDAADVVDDAVFTPANVVPPNGVLSYADIYAAYSQTTGRPVQHAAAVQLTACTVVSYLFPSEWVRQCIPIPAAPPLGYVDVVHRCCRLTIPVASTSSKHNTASHRLRGGPIERVARVLCTLDGTATSVAEVPSTMPYTPTTLCVPLDSERPQPTETAGLQSTREKAGSWQPWPSTAPVSTQPRLLHVVVEEEAPAGTSNVSSVAPATATFVVPPVLPPPVVEYSALHQSLRMHVPGYRTDQVEIRYTLDGSVPTSATGQVYKEAVLLDAKRGTPGQGVVHVRAVAFPRLYFASRVAETLIDVCQDVSPSTPSGQSVQLQDDEQLSSTSRVQWGSPILTQRTPKKTVVTASSVQPPQQRSFSSSPHSPRCASTSASSKKRGCRLSQKRHSGGSLVAGSDAYFVVSDAPMTRSAQLRQAFNAGLYTPPRRPFSQGEGYTASPRSQKGSGRC